MQTQRNDSPGVIAFPPLIFLLTLLIGVAVHLFHPVPISPERPLRVAGGVSMLFAGFIALAARAEMRKSGTNINPNLPATAIVTGGPFRFTRNPMYLSLCLLNMGIGLVLCDLVPTLLTLLLFGVLHFGVIIREERYLGSKFGEAYASYRRRTRRWI